MHIADGILSAPVLAGGAVLAAAGVSVGLKKIDYDALPRVAVLSSAFYAASLVHVPVGFSSAHLILNGLVGIVLGWAAFPALLVALFLQSIMFGHGGLTVLGVNTLDMALPAVLCYHLFGRRIRSAASRRSVLLLGCLAGAFAVFSSALLVSAALFLSGREFFSLAAVVLLANLPIMVVEGLVTGSAAVFLWRVRPELLEPRPTASGEVLGVR